MSVRPPPSRNDPTSFQSRNSSRRRRMRNAAGDIAHCGSTSHRFGSTSHNVLLGLFEFQIPEQLRPGIQHFQQRCGEVRQDPTAERGDFEAARSF